MRAGGGAGQGATGPERPGAAPGAPWELWPDAGWTDAGSGPVARGRMVRQDTITGPSTPSRGTGVDGAAKGTFATF